MNFYLKLFSFKCYYTQNFPFKIMEKVSFVSYYMYDFIIIHVAIP